MPPRPIDAGGPQASERDRALSTRPGGAHPEATGESAGSTADRAGRPAEARSLFGEILDWMFAPLLLLWPMSVTLTYLVAQSIASSPYDRALVERGEALAAQVQFDGAGVHFELAPAFVDIYGAGTGEAATYLVVDARGRVLGGDADLPHERAPAAPAAQGTTAAAPGQQYNGAFRLRDDTLRGHPVRVAYAWLAGPAPASGPASAAGQAPADAVLVAVAEPPTERTQLANEIVKGVILPQFIVLPLALLLVWFGLTRGLAPLARLQQTIRNRPPDDLSPIHAESAPEELSPLLGSFNELLARMSRNLAAQRRFIADAAHQMKTPLAGLRTQAELAQRGGDAQELQRSLRQIAASTERATHLVNQMLSLARAEHDASGPATRVGLDLDQLARSAVQDWVGTALAHHIDLGYEGPGAAPGGAHGARMQGSPVALREMLNNLIDNAIRYTAAAPVSAHADSPADALPAAGGAVTVRVGRSAHGVTLEVEDNGPGIAAEERAQVFERFYRILGSRQDGSGLGLAIVREIAAQHGATVQLGPAGPSMALQPGRPGTRFCIHFPERAGGPQAPARSV